MKDLTGVLVDIKKKKKKSLSLFLLSLVCVVVYLLKRANQSVGYF